MRIKKTITAICVLIFALLAAAVPAFADLPARPIGTCVRDTADVLPDETSEELASITSALAEKNGTGIYILTVPGFEGKKARDYAVAAFEKWQLTGREVILVVDTKDRDYYALAGSEVSEFVDSESIKGVLARAFEPGFAAGNDGAAAVSFFTSFSSVLASVDFPIVSESGNAFLRVVVVILILLCLLIIGVFVIRTVNINRSRRRRRAARYVNGRQLPVRRPRR